MSRKHRILIIDDNRTIVDALKLFLSQKYEIATANNGVEGLEAIEQIENGIDLVITDLVMPAHGTGTPLYLCVLCHD